MDSASRTLLIRADADGQIGTGHVMRCLALAETWQEEGGMARIVTTAGVPEWVRLRLSEAGIPIEILDANAGSRDDALVTARRAQDLAAGAIVLDGTSFDASFLRLMPSGPWWTLVVDDTGGRYSAVDFVVNPNFGASVELYSGCDSGVRLLLGIEYALLRREFRSARSPWRRREDRAFRLLATFGGGDTDSELCRFLEWIAPDSLSRELKVVVTGEADFAQRALHALSGSFASTDIVRQPANMAAAMGWAGIKYCPGKHA